MIVVLPFSVVTSYYDGEEKKNTRGNDYRKGVLKNVYLIELYDTSHYTIETTNVNYIYLFMYVHI